jgi:hypothetical protein
MLLYPSDMIARLWILLPFDLLIREGDNLQAVEITSPERKLRFYPPTHYATRPSRAGSALSPLAALKTAKLAEFCDTALVGNKKIAEVNVCVIDTIKTQFDRSKDKLKQDPEIQAAFDFANFVLSCMRVFSRSFNIRPIESGRDAWQLSYLKDDGSLVDEEEGKCRTVTTAASVIGYAAITPESVERITDPVINEPFTWDHLLLDAYALLPDIGSSIVMAYAALEVFISWALDILEKQKPLPDGMWKWLNTRDHWSKQPSVSEQFDHVLKTLSGQSLKDEQELWLKLVELKRARNSLVHEGVAKIGSEKVSASKARELVNGASSIIKWAELLLPVERRRTQAEAAGPFSRKMVTVEECAVLDISIDADITAPKLASE